MASYLTGDKAKIWIATTNGTTYAISDFSITLDRGTVEQPLVGESGNAILEGALSVEGSLTQCRFAASGNSPFFDSLTGGSVLKISGSISGSSLLKWSFKSCQITSIDVSIGDASTISEASIDWTLLDPYNVTYSSGKISD